MKPQKIEKEINKQKITLSTNLLARQANGAVLVEMNNATVLGTAVMGIEKKCGFFTAFGTLR